MIMRTFICMYEILKGLVQILRSGVMVLRRWRQVDLFEFKASLSTSEFQQDHIMRPCLKKKMLSCPY